MLVCKFTKIYIIMPRRCLLCMWHYILTELKWKRWMFVLFIFWTVCRDRWIIKMFISTRKREKIKIKKKYKKIVSKLKSLIELSSRKIRRVHLCKGNVTIPWYQYRLNKAGLITWKGLYTIVRRIHPTKTYPQKIFLCTFPIKLTINYYLE